MAKNNPNTRNSVPAEDGRWNVRKPGAGRASAHYDTQKQAIDRGRQILKNTGGGELTIHDQHGKIREKDTVAPETTPTRRKANSRRPQDLNDLHLS
jgi:Uncharacterized protein conserved in bacteria (DUF2188)